MAGRQLPLPASLSGVEEDFASGLVPLALFNNDEVYALEMQRIFARTWVFIGHVSEVPTPGDFVSRFIGRDPFIFTHGADGQLRVFFNACRHRGAKVCRVDRGNTPEFVCPFHGWTFNNKGELTGVPARKTGYKELDFGEWGLFQTPKIVNYHGLIFVALDPDAPSFEEHLGDYKWYLDIQFALSPKGMTVLGEPHRWVVDANWKQGAENFCGDSSHTPTTHKSALAAGMVRKEFLTSPGQKFRVHATCGGHSISIRQVEESTTAFWDYPEEVYRHFTTNKLEQAQLDVARRAINHNGTVFPNFSFLHFSFTDSADRPSAGFLSIRVWQPIAPGKTEIWNWIMAPAEASEEYKARAYNVGMSSFGPSGSFEQDDVALWPGVAQAAGTMFAQTNNIKLNYQMGLGGMGDTHAPFGWQGPGHVLPTSATEGGPRTFHQNWYRWMTKP
jgi:phenylpropionate dioxygenase-like ring-hydroxylating dioxygenase large terminal subunit